MKDDQCIVGAWPLVLFSLVTMIVLGLSVTTASADTNNAASESRLAPYKTSCMAVYPHFAVNAALFTPVTDTVSGTDLDVTANFTNKTEYPVDDAVLYAQVYQYPEAGADISEAILVDQFVAVSGVSVEPDAEISESFTWSIPSWLPTGDYVISTSITANHVHSLSGSPLWSRVSGNTLDLTVTNDAADRVNPFVVIPQDIAVNGQLLARSAEMPRIDNDETAQVSVPLQNNTQDAQSLQINWRLYKYNQITPEHEVALEQERVVVPPGGSFVAEHSFTPQGHGSYVAVAEFATTLGERQVVNAPFAIGDVFDPYVKFVALEENANNGVPYLYACIDKHGGGFAAENVSLSTMLETSQQERILSDAERVSIMTDPVLQVVSITDIGFTRATATLTLSAGGGVLDEQQFAIRCRGGDCLPGDDGGADTANAGGAISNLFYLIGASLVAVVALGLLLSAPLLRRLFKRSNNSHDDT